MTADLKTKTTIERRLELRCTTPLTLGELRRFVDEALKAFGDETRVHVDLVPQNGGSADRFPQLLIVQRTNDD